ncbi:hypothetical protein F5148DRAFT_151066 [Russula earlei]|uniref:Uncharacterized protein n=1 Tax=Russula earlei TaxID=71964 RepID=A0ACC0U6X7_9AGAM|nr:hypothetical protein F5148DRAFT_151066 [Russula earlei]
MVRSKGGMVSAIFIFTSPCVILVSSSARSLIEDRPTKQVYGLPHSSPTYARTALATVFSPLTDRHSFHSPLEGLGESVTHTTTICRNIPDVVGRQVIVTLNR